MLFVMGVDPVQFGLVQSLSRPGGNITGVTFLTTTLEAKRFGILRELVPSASSFGVLINPSNAGGELQTKEVTEAARNLGVL